MLSVPSKGISSNRKTHTMTEGGTNASYHKMESTLMKAESYCSTSVDGHFPRTMQVISVRTAHSQIAPITNKPQSSNTADIQQSTNVHCAHHDIQILPHGQRGIRIEQDRSTYFGSKRQTATQKKHTQANSEWLVGSWSGQIHSIFSYHSVPRTVSPTMLNGTR